MLQVSALFVYPIKSLGGISLLQSPVTDRGLQYDRRWMLVDATGKFLSQRQLPQMALLQVTQHIEGWNITHKKSGSQTLVSFKPQTADEVKVTVWDSQSIATRVSDAADAWFSEQLGVGCRLVYMPDNNPILVDTEYAHHGEHTSFSDGYPFLLIGQSSLDELNSRLVEPVPINRFRPNIVVSGAQPFAEDFWTDFKIGDLQFFGVKRCGRCIVTTINQDEGTTAKEPLKTLASYRTEGNKIFFGQNLLHRGKGDLSVGDTVQLLA